MLSNHALADRTHENGRTPAVWMMTPGPQSCSSGGSLLENTTGSILERSEVSIIWDFACRRKHTPQSSDRLANDLATFLPHDRWSIESQGVSERWNKARWRLSPPCGDQQGDVGGTKLRSISYCPILEQRNQRRKVQWPAPAKRRTPQFAGRPLECTDRRLRIRRTPLPLPGYSSVARISRSVTTSVIAPAGQGSKPSAI